MVSTGQLGLDMAPVACLGAMPHAMLLTAMARLRVTAHKFRALGYSIGGVSLAATETYRFRLWK
jgi:hypothetical protein